MQNRTILDNAIVDLTLAIDQDGSLEAVFQRFFEENTCVFDILGFSKFIAHPVLTNPSGESFIPDFLCQDLCGLWHIVEIKRADAKVGVKAGGRRHRPYAEMSEWISQGREYSQWISQSPAKQEFENQHKTKIQDNPSVIIIAGQATVDEHIKMHSTTSAQVPHVRVITYADILNNLFVYREKNYGGVSSSNGCTLIACLALAQPKTLSPILFAGLNSENDSSLLIEVSGDFEIFITWSLTNGQSKKVKIDSYQHKQIFKKAFVLSVEVLADNLMTRLWVKVNNLEILYLAEDGAYFKFSSPIPFIIGSDQSYNDSADLISLFNFLAYKPLPPSEYRTIYDFSKSMQMQPNQSFIHMSPGQFMYTEGHPVLDKEYPIRTNNLVQRDNNKRPALQDFNSLPDWTI